MTARRLKGGGKWVGMYNPATKALTETPEPEDF